MPVEYAKTATKLTPVELSADVLLDMGRLIRACAEIEDLVGLHLMQMADIREGHLIVLLGRTTVSTKLALATTFAESIGGNCLACHQACFSHPSFKQLIKCRNVIAHGTLLGQTDDGRLAFRTVDVVATDANAVTVNVISYEALDFRNYVKLAEELVPFIEKTLKLQKLRAERRARDLLPHRKSQETGRRGAKPGRQRKGRSD